MDRVFNFSAGPSALPEEVLKKAAAEMLNYNGAGMSVMEMSHRSPVYQSIIDEAETLCRELLQVPDNYKVLFLQGGASSQFAMVPLNLFRDKKVADYIDTGAWSKKAIAEAKRYGTVNVIASSADTTYNYLPELPAINEDAEYVHITSNNTIYGTQWKTFPETGDKPLVSDMSSDIMSRPLDVSKFGIIYAGAQKNLGPSGVTLVIIREDLCEEALDITPTMFRYKTHSDNGSMFNTPPTYGIYMMKLVFDWLKEMGGIAGVQAKNEYNANLVYNYLDNSKMFKGTVRKEDRSTMNIPFILPTDELNAEFIKGASERGMVNLKGHRSVGGMRASMYNAMPKAGAEALVAYMKEFEASHS